MRVEADDTDPPYDRDQLWVCPFCGATVYYETVGDDCPACGALVALTSVPRPVGAVRAAPFAFARQMGSGLDGAACRVHSTPNIAKRPLRGNGRFVRDGRVTTITPKQTSQQTPS